MSFSPRGARRGPTSQVPFTPILALMILTVLFSLRTLAFASPPDPVWIAGIYDGKDGDDAIARIAGRAGATHAVTWLPLPVVGPDLLPLPGPPDYHHHPAAAQARGPPALAGVVTISLASRSRSDRGLPPRPRPALAPPPAYPHDRGRLLRARGPPAPRSGQRVSTRAAHISSRRLE